ncbi:hypothetical protein LCGC14_2482000 [marine sediment metagenome]|uniref:AAA domain-containing protein n=1 Tax=marine sediment metagenome TaxID=412755 RepID=A0A0F9B847_9ZZZZ
MLPPEQRMNALWVGKPGTRKSITASEFHKLGPVYFFDFDGKADALYAWYGGRLPDNITIEPFVESAWATETAKAESIDALQLQVNSWMKEFATFDEVRKRIVWNDFPYDTVVLDSLSSFDTAMMIKSIEDQLHDVPRPAAQVPDRSDYNILLTYTRQFMGKFLSLPCNVIVIAHVMASAGEEGATMDQIIVSGRKLPGQLPAFFSNIWGFTAGVGFREKEVDPKTGLAVPNVEFKIRLHPTRNFPYKCMYYPCPPAIDSSFEAIQKMRANAKGGG